MSVYVRWRPASSPEPPLSHTSSPSAPLAITLSFSTKTWTSPPSFDTIIPADADNAAVFTTAVEPSIPQALRGGTCSFFAYGHSGSGKTHTIFGYDDTNDANLGLCLAAARRLFREIGESEIKLGIGLSLFELRKDAAFDLLNGRTKCHVREGADHKIHIRGPTETLPDGRVRVRPIVQRACWALDEFQHQLSHALGRRSVGSSSVHDQSSRTHAVVGMEVVSEQLVNAREDLVERQSELVPVGKRATDINIEEQSKGVIRTPEGKWAPNPEYTINQARIDAAEAEKAEYEERVNQAEATISSILTSPTRPPSLGGRMVFIDLAGAEYHTEKGTPLPPKQTPQERQEGRQINSDLLALKEVMRAWAKGQERVPYRASPLTMVLREHFAGSRDDISATVVVTVSPDGADYAATLNSLKYGALVGGRS